MFKLFQITGDSLYPYYKNGQKVLCRRVSPKTKINIDDVVVFENDIYGLMIKRVTNIKNNCYFVEGTNPYSIDSRVFGTLTKQELKYKVLGKFPIL